MNIVKAHSVFSAMVVGASLTVRSAAIALGNEMVEGFFDLQITATTGTGTARIQYELSNDGRRDGLEKEKNEALSTNLF